MRVLIAILLVFAAAGVQANTLRSIQLLDEGNNARAVFDLDAAPQATVFTLDNPDRLVVDFSGTTATTAVRARAYTAGVVKDVRFGRRTHGMRVVLDLKHGVRVHQSTLPASSNYGHRLILDMTASSTMTVLAPAPPGTGTKPVVARTTATPARKPRAAADVHPSATAIPVGALRTKPIVVAIDAGHGGKDPGARGPDGLEEKTVTLAIARKLAKLIDGQPGMKAVLTRKGDYYVGLRERMVEARKAHADAFISIHANASRDPNVRGTAVYMLSQHGATSEQARWVADRENAADMVGGIDISDKSSRLASVLVDISQSATMDASFDLGRRLLHEMGEISPVLHDDARVHRAAFVVLKAPDIPSVLVETEFITNRHEEHLLGSSRYQEKIARQLLTGIDGYFAHYRPKERVPLQTARRGGLETVDYAPLQGQAVATR